MTQWQPEKQGLCVMHGFAPLLMCVTSTDLQEFAPFQVNRDLFCGGGGIVRNTFSLQKLYNWAKKNWCFWTRPTDGYDLCKYIKTKLYLYPHPSVSYIIHWDTEYKSNNIYGWPWYHPSIMLNKSSHRIVWSKAVKPGGKTQKLTLRPPATVDDQWWFMRDFYTQGLFAYQASIIEVQDPMTMPRDVQFCFDLHGSLPNAQQKDSKKYWWYFDSGFGNGVSFADQAPTTYAAAISKDEPYYISLWGSYNNQTVWIWAPEDWTDPTQGNRFWLKLQVPSLNTLIRSGPFVSKGVNRPVSLFYKYKAYFKWGGPSATEEINTGQDPGHIPPDRVYQASKELSGLQIRCPLTVGDGVAHPWEYRRGILTARGLQRLTTSPPTEAEFEHPEIELLPSDDESSSSASEAEEEEEPEILW